MKLKNIFLVFVLGAIWGFSSCSSEEIIDTPQNGEATLSISLSVNDIETKAGEQIATSEELQISNCHIVVFDNESGVTNGKFITSFDFSDGDGLTGDNNNYTCTSQQIRTFGLKRNVKFLAIANIDKNVNQLEDVAGKSYSEYLNAVVTSSSFNSTSLVKVGEKDYLIEKDKSYTVEIKLTQLTARFDFEGITMGGGNSASKAASSNESYRYEFLTKTELDEHQSLKNAMSNVFYYGGGSWSGNSFQAEYGSQRVIGIKITKTTSQPSGTQFSDTKVWGINKKSIIGAYKGGSNDASESPVEGVTFGERFYTYKNVSDEFKVNVVKSSNQSVFYGYIYQSDYYGYGWSPSLNNLSSESDVYNEKNQKITIKNISWGNNGSQGETFTLDLSKVDFENGKRYTIKGTYNPTVSAEIDWVVQDWSSKENINIGFN